MSRYELQPKSYTPRVASVVVGWDRPLNTFFAQVFMKSGVPGDEPEATIWEGTELGQIQSAAEALALIDAYADVPADMAARLEVDRDNSRSQADGPMQLGMKRLIFPPSND